MKPLKVEFVRHRQIAWWLPAGLCAALTVAALQQAWFAWESRERAVTLDGEIARLSAQNEAAVRARQDSEAAVYRPPPYEKDALAIARTAGFPLDRVLTVLELTQVLGIKITAIETSALDGEVRVTVEFADYGSLLRYLEELNDGEAVPRWSLLQAQVAQAGTSANTGVLVSRWTSADR